VKLSSRDANPSQRQVQEAHRIMGRTKRSWPDIAWPTERGNMTAESVLAMPAGQVRDEAIHEWCAQVWAAFTTNRRMLASLLAEYTLP
jgi:hypothetical protein